MDADRSGEDGSGARADLLRVKAHFEALQDSICDALEREDGEAQFDRRVIPRDGGGESRPRVLSDGPVLERAAVQFTHTVGKQLPPVATERHPELTGGSYEAVSMSLIVHPRNPYVPTTHANFRLFFAAPPGGAAPTWWFGGGFDLTPYYGFEEDAIHWHRTARDVCEPFGSDLYPKMKADCDAYFYLKHREEPRGIGGIFFDDLDSIGDGSFESSFAFVASVSDAFLRAYLPILQRRKHLPYGDRERDFQLYRRGRYVEYNLLYDRGTRFGLQIAGRAESILASMPPRVAWRYDWRPEPGTPEEKLYTDFLQRRDWLSR